MENWSTYLMYGAAISFLMFAGSILIAWFLIIRMPADFLIRDSLATTETRKHFLFRAGWFIVRNVIGLLLFFSGLVMLVTPGQGLLFIFLGLVFLDFPGKRSLIHRLISQRKINHSINRIRAKAGKPALELPPSSDADSVETSANS